MLAILNEILSELRIIREKVTILTTPNEYPPGWHQKDLAQHLKMARASREDQQVQTKAFLERARELRKE